MRITCEPPIHQWRPAFDTSLDRAELIPLLNRPEAQGRQRVDRVIATGHQAWLWHPGILAKDIAMTRAARQLDATAVHVVDQDVLDNLSLALPIVKDGRLDVFRLSLAEHDAAIPTGCQPPADAVAVERTLTKSRGRWGQALLADIEPIIQAYAQVQPCATLAEQTTAVLAHLMLPYTGPVVWMYSSHLGQLASFRRLVGDMVHDAHRCAACYNHAVAEYPQAGVGPLNVETDRVELPLWVLAWQQPRQQVYVDTSRTDPVLVRANGQRIDEGRGDRMAPKALLLTATMRSLVCDWFIHGQGGATYDRVTDHWWSTWVGQPLAPTSLVTADLRMSFGVPVSDGDELSAAVWWNHHLPCNLDRALQLRGHRVEQKRRLIRDMNDDRDRARRAAAYTQIQSINREFAKQYPEALRDARRKLQRARIGLANRKVGLKRDWCFGLHEPGQLKTLAKAFNCRPLSNRRTGNGK